MEQSHCMHDGAQWRREDQQCAIRYCCWCGLTQCRVDEAKPIHGPRFKGERFSWHWEPSSMNECPRDAEAWLQEREG